jgi:hypothetical protein
MFLPVSWFKHLTALAIILRLSTSLQGLPILSLQFLPILSADSAIAHIGVGVTLVKMSLPLDTHKNLVPYLYQENVATSQKRYQG